MQVRDVMTMPAVTATDETSIGTALRLMRDEQITSLAVVDDCGTLVGVVGLADLLPDEARPDRVGDVRTPHAVTVRVDDDIATAIDRMQSTPATILPVVASGRVVGTISLHDILDVLADRSIHTELFAGSGCGTIHRV
ncbi:HPP family protein [Kribbella sindirgiensis]|nr:CBS domain-containing protein [Kribbella sindirgiensis]